MRYAVDAEITATGLPQMSAANGDRFVGDRDGVAKAENRRLRW